MRVGLRTILVLSCLTVALAVTGSWVRQAETGLARLLSGTLAVGLPEAPANSTLLAEWRAPNGSTVEPSIAMSESDWLNLADGLAPVSYLPAPVEPPAPALVEQQPL